MYHYVRDITNSRYPNIKGIEIEDFKNQIKFFKDKYSIITMESFLECINDKNPLPKNAALLTFDDGYVDHYINVLPILVENNIQGSFFIPASFISEEVLLDVNKIHFILSNCPDVNLIISFLFDRLNHYRVKFGLLGNDYYYEKLAHPNRFDNKDVIFIKRLLQSELELSLRQIILNELFNNFFDVSQSIFSKELYLNIDQIRLMKKLGMFIGAHGYNHLWLGLIGEEEQKEEINKSVDFLNKLGIPKKQRVFCFPYGSFNNYTIDLLEQNEFSCAFTTIPSISDINLNDKFKLPRLDTNDFPISKQCRQENI
jgi:peptidoglycan/xylan/chitin deacetylase (PgdA/CDA1 family)